MATTRTAVRSQRAVSSSSASPSKNESLQAGVQLTSEAHSHADDALHEDRGSGTSLSALSSRDDSEPLTDIDSASRSSREADEVAQALDASSALPPPAPASGSSSAFPTASSSSKTSSSLPRVARPAYLYVDPDTSCAAPEEPSDDIAGVPVFTPTWDEFRDFYSYCERIDAWGMRSGIVKIIPPREWTQNLPRLDGRDSATPGSSKAGACYTLDNRLSQVRIKNSIEQIFTPGGSGVWRQSNVVHPARIVNAKQWADTCASEGQRGPEMARMKGVVARQSAEGSQEAEKEDGVRTRSGRGAQSARAESKSTPAKTYKRKHEATEADNKSTPNKQKMAERTTQDEWEAFDYVRDWCKEAGVDAKPEDWTPEVCRAIEQEYWRTLNYGKPPMYGADLAGTLFTEETRDWNVGKLDNLLTRLRLRRKLPGVTTPYLYFGMWRATFAWHVEDMDLYSINYIHFGAPKQWYAIRQADKKRFELAMANAFPADSNRCRHFMRHKSYLASPTFLGSAAGSVKPLRLVQHAQEFVITYPYGYHSGYNLGFNCAESVNFALESWLDIGRKAGYCDCTHDSVKMDVDAMLEESQEMEELERKRQERERRREEEEAMNASEAEKIEARRARAKEARLRRKEEQALKGEPDAEPARVPKKARHVEPCIFCPSMLEEDLVAVPSDNTSTGKPTRSAHRLCASFLPETWVAANPATADNAKQPKEIVMGVEGIPKARWGLKCQLCTEASKQKRGAKVQCTYQRCSRTSHVSCALEETSGWVLDVLDDDEADKLEGHGNRKPSQAKVEDEEEAAPRLVVLCHMHNPALRQQEARRKAEILRMVARGLAPGQTVIVRVGAGTWETMLKSVDVPEGPLPEEPTRADDETVVATLIDGKVVPVSKLIIPSDVAKRLEAEYDALDAARYERMEADTQAAVAALQARQEARDTERQARKAELEQKRRAREAKKAALASESAVPASAVVNESAISVQQPKPKRTYKKRKTAAESLVYAPMLPTEGNGNMHMVPHFDGPPLHHQHHQPLPPMHMMPMPHGMGPQHGPVDAMMMRPMFYPGPGPMMMPGHHFAPPPGAHVPQHVQPPFEPGMPWQGPGRMMPTPMPPPMMHPGPHPFYAPYGPHPHLPPIGTRPFSPPSAPPQEMRAGQGQPLQMRAVREDNNVLQRFTPKKEFGVKHEL